MMPAAPRFEALLARRRYGILPFVLALLPVMFAGWLLANNEIDSELLKLSAGAVLASLFFLSRVVARKPLARVRSADVRVYDRTLQIGAGTYALDDLGDGVVFELDHRAIVRLSRRFRPAIELAAPTLEKGRALLRAIGRDGTQYAVRFTARSPLRARVEYSFVAGMVGLPMLGVLGLMLHHPVFPAAFASLSYALVALWPAHVDVGSDGVLHRWLFWTWFYPKEKIERATRRDEVDASGRGTSRVEIGLRGEDEPRTIVMGDRWAAESASRALVERVEEILAEDAVSASAPAQLAREGRPVRDWIASLRSLARHASYRSVAVDDDDLWRVVESTTASAEERAAAAVALARDNDGRARVRVAANAVVAPRLRVALEAAAEGDERELESALEALANEEAV